MSNLPIPEFNFREEALLILTNGETEVIRPEQNGAFGLQELYNHLRCGMIEIVRLRGNVKLPAMVLIVDEEGKMNGSDFNDKATKIMDSSSDHIRGRAIYCWRKLIK